MHFVPADDPTSTSAAYTDITSILDDYLTFIWNIFPRGFLRLVSRPLPRRWLMVNLVLFLACSRPDADSKPDAPDTGISVDTQPTESDTTGVDTGESGGETGDTKETNETGETADTDTALDTGPVLCDRSLGWKYVACGDYQTCGIHTDGCAECWGRGEAESAPNPDTGVPHYHWHGEDEPPAGEYASIYLINNDGTDGDTPNACGLRVDESLLCWGDESTGTNAVPTGKFVDVSVWSNAAYAISSEHLAAIWVAPAEPPTGTFDQVAVGNGRALFLTTGGEVVMTWPGHPETEPGPNGTFLTITAGDALPCALKDDGSILCWYYEDVSDPDSNPMTVAAPDGPFVDVCMTGGWEGCAMNADGEVDCWSVSGTPEQPPDGETFSQLACGAGHACGVTFDERIVCWGNNVYGETIPPT